MSRRDPFTQVLDRLWELLESHEGFSSLVPLANRRKDAPGQAAHRPGRLPGDWPEVRIEPGGGSVDLLATSTSSRAVQLFVLTVSAGPGQAARLLLPLKWQLVRALSRCGPSLGLPFVRKVRVAQLREPFAADAGRLGDTSVRLTVAVELWLDSLELQQ